MPDTMIPTEATSPPAPALCGVLSDYRSPLIGQLVAARAKAAGEIKRIIKDKKAEIPNKQGGRGYQYAYADLAGVMEAVEDALAAQEMAIFQTIQERGGKPVLVTTLAHSSDQWISSEVRIASPDAGPQVFGSSLTYMRRYSALAILGIAPDTDDDGKAAQERADQARQRPAQRVEQPKRPATSQQTQATPRPSNESKAPEHMPVPMGTDGLLVGKWTKDALDILTGKPEVWRREWLAMHEQEMETVQDIRPDYAGKVASAAIAPDLPEVAA